MSGSDAKERILRLIDDSENTWLKAAFYGDPKVSAILERLFEAWESAGRRGMPIDYATREELEDLEKAAVKYASMSEAELQMIAYGRMTGSEEGLSLARFIRRLLGLD
ncbi:hypothetical protein APE_1977.1 [Aeropyrum pernix K1]|uniref:Uncharacterized protein n=1 Tax=Aeropyrum pernix (strain ATCC 700893 / DSM 11879 / JCM 9820 / NBRC 100138 / K1) TaxID=272557 RepID=Q9YAG2_AERPE|nr:hypothetical protein [Aeropyrum pernix]BAA80987.2 hypothetical protein APE_1977.1 [Aeropyrum pernix K1]